MTSGPPSWIVCKPFAGMESQCRGLAGAAGLAPDIRALRPRFPYRQIPAALWPNPFAAFAPELLAPPLPAIAIGCGRMGGAVVAALRAPETLAVQIQHPRMDPKRFDLLVVNPHDHLTGPNVIVARNAMHRVTNALLAEAAAAWAPRLSHLPRPLVSVLTGGSNGRYRFGAAEAAALGGQLAAMMRQERVGVAVTLSRRTGAAATKALTAALSGTGAYIWDGTGENPYFGLLALADALIVTQDSVSMMSEAIATSAPVLVAPLPGRSRRQGEFLQGLIDAGRVRLYTGRFVHWPAAPVNDTPEAGAAVRRLLGF